MEGVKTKVLGADSRRESACSLYLGVLVDMDRQVDPENTAFYRYFRLRMGQPNDSSQTSEDM